MLYLSTAVFILLATMCVPGLCSFADREREVLGGDKSVNVAFVLAGTPRSLVVPAVHESIRENLIRALCPYPLCHSHIYARISRADNTHIPNDAVGITTKANSNASAASIQDEAVTYALNRLKSEDDVLYTTIMDTGSEEELQEMVAHAEAQKESGKKLQHTIYRKLDPRRYSMHFSRDRAYRLMVSKENEATGGRGYDWVVHCRMDTAWAEPINQPVFSFDASHIFVPSMWYADVPDTFAIIPRQHAETYFDVDKLIMPRVMCLGGPNFDPKTALPEHLDKLGFITEAEKTAVHEALCLTMFKNKGHTVVHEKKTNTTWATSGYSEYLLKRKLKRAGLDSYRGSNGPLDSRSFVVFHPFSVFIVRYYPGEEHYALPSYRYLTASAADSVVTAQRHSPRVNRGSVSMMCFYLRARQHIPFSKTVMPSNDALHASCILMSKLVRPLAVQMPWSLPCSVMLPYRRRQMRQSQNSDTTAAATAVAERECNPLEATSTTALDALATDWNFMPFRLRFRANKCVTASVPVHVKKAASAHHGGDGHIFAGGEEHAARALNLQYDAVKKKITSDMHRLTISRPHVAPCINYWRDKENMVQYQKTQLFSFFPLLGAVAMPQQIIVMDHEAGDAPPLCLTLGYDRTSAYMAASQGRDWTGTADTTSTSGSSSSSSVGKKDDEDEVLFISPCQPFDWQRMRTYSPAVVDEEVKKAAHQLFLLDIVESGDASARRLTAQRRMKQEQHGGTMTIGTAAGSTRSAILDALSVGVIRWSPSAIAGLAAGEEGSAIPGAHGSSLGERGSDSGDLCVTVSTSGSGSGGGGINNATGIDLAWRWWGPDATVQPRPEHVSLPPGLVLRRCPLSVAVDKDKEQGVSTSALQPTATQKKAKKKAKAAALPAWVLQNVTSILDYYHSDSYVENPFATDFDPAAANAGLFHVSERRKRRKGGTMAAVVTGRRLMANAPEGEDVDSTATAGGKRGGGRRHHGRGSRRGAERGNSHHKLGQLSRFLFVMERTRSNVSPLAPGLVVGKTPSWSGQ